MLRVGLAAKDGSQILVYWEEALALQMLGLPDLSNRKPPCDKVQGAIIDPSRIPGCCKGVRMQLAEQNPGNEVRKG